MIHLPEIFVTEQPSAKTAVSLFQGDWVSRYPTGAGVNTGGTVALFEDPRLRWADIALTQVAGKSFKDQRVIEFGPLEAGHTYMLTQNGAREVVAVEANSKSYIKCLITKEVLRLQNATFLLGDGVEYLKHSKEHFDVGFACGFLYHLVNPVEFIARLSERCERVFICTAVFSHELFRKNPDLVATFGPPQTIVFEGFRHEIYPHSYGRGFDSGKFLGGIESTCSWMKSEDVIGALRHFGFTKMVQELEDNPYGVTLSVAASK